MNRKLLCSTLRRFVVLIALLGAGFCCQAVTFSVTPNSTSNTYAGFITLQATSLPANETVVIRKYLDLNNNGIVEASDYFIQQLQVQDGEGPTLIGGATNINIPYDHSAADGSITTTMPMGTVGIIHRFAARYLYVLSSPSNHFAAITNSFLVTNPPTGQTITGTVTSNSVPVPYTAVLVGLAINNDFSPQTGTIANSSGVYSIDVPQGSYLVVPLHNNNVGVPSGPIDVLAGTTVTNDLSVVAANATISGQVVDSANPSIPLPGLLLAAEGNGFATSVTDPNGNFSLSVTTGSDWKISGDDSAWSPLGYVSSNDHPKITVTGNISGLQLGYPKGNAMFYGRVVDSNNQPLAGVRLFGENANGSGSFQGNAVTDANGEYAMAVVDGNWDIEVDSGALGLEFANYIFSRSPFGYSNGGGGTNLSPKSAVRQDFLAVFATNKISGYLRDTSSNGIPGVQVFANATVNGIAFSAQATSDSSGFFSIPVGNGTWDVFVNCCDGCDNGLPSGYQCPGNQSVVVSNDNHLIYFTAAAYTAFLSGRVSDEFGNAVSNINVFAFATNGGGGFGVMTDNGGMYSIGLIGGSYTVELDTDASSGAPSRGLVSPSIAVTIPDNSTVSNFNLVARHITGTIVATITNGDNGQPVSAVYISASATINGTNYSSGVQQTSGSGAATLSVFNGTWSVGVDCFGLTLQNLTCAPNQNANVANNSVPVGFIVHNIGAPQPPFLSQPHRNPGQFQFQLTATPGQNYTIQYATALTNWTTFLVTNPPSADVMIFDNGATNSARMYRVLVGP